MRCVLLHKKPPSMLQHPQLRSQYSYRDEIRVKKTGAQNNKAGALQKERPAQKGRAVIWLWSRDADFSLGDEGRAIAPCALSAGSDIMPGHGSILPQDYSRRKHRLAITASPHWLKASLRDRSKSPSRTTITTTHQIKQAKGTKDSIQQSFAQASCRITSAALLTAPAPLVMTPHVVPAPLAAGLPHSSPARCGPHHL